MWVIVSGRVEGGHSVTLRKAISSHIVKLSEKKLRKAFYGPRTSDHGTRFLVCVEAVAELYPLLRSLKESLAGFTLQEEPRLYFARDAGVKYSIW